MALGLCRTHTALIKPLWMHWMGHGRGKHVCERQRTEDYSAGPGG